MILGAGLSAARAGSASWNLNPATGDWNTAANWSPATVPNGPADTATFNFSNQTALSLSASTEVNGIVFNPGASAYNIFIPDGTRLTLSGSGISSSATAVETILNESELIFLGNAKAGSAVLSNRGGTTLLNASATDFHNFASADHATIVNGGGESSTFSGAQMFFYESSTAGSATFINQGASGSAGGGNTGFYDQSNAGDCLFSVNGGSGVSTIGSNGGNLFFAEKSSAGNANIIVNPGSSSGDGGTLGFIGSASGGTARVELFGNGSCDISGHGKTSVPIGSLEGDGIVTLGARTLAIGSNGLSTIFSGVLKDGGISGGVGGKIEKIGPGTLSLRGASTYTGSTTVSEGTLKIANPTGSATGTGAVAVNRGTLGGTGTIAGQVTFGTATGAGAYLEPSVGASRPANLTCQGSAIFKSDSVYTYKLNTKKAKADQFTANGVTLESGAQFDLAIVANRKLTAGAGFTALNNTAATPINGTFANLPNGATLNAGGNTLKVSYHGGDGNDLTLTVIP